MHAALPGGGEVGAPIFLPGNLWGGVSFSRTLQPRRRPCPAGDVVGSFDKGGQHWWEKNKKRGEQFPGERAVFQAVQTALVPRQDVDAGGL